MSVAAIEIKSGAIAASSSSVVSIATSLTASDRVVVIIFKDGTAGTPTASGLGTWSTIVAGSGTRDHYMFTMTGATSGGNITVTTGGAAADYVVYVLRSSIGAAISVFGTDEAATVGSNTAVVTGGLANMFACLSAMVTPGTITAFPDGSALPATGWTSDYTGVNTATAFAHQTLSAASDVQSGGSSSGATTWIMIAAIFSDGDTGTPLPPLESSFIGWGVDAGIA